MTASPVTITRRLLRLAYIYGFFVTDVKHPPGICMAFSGEPERSDSIRRVARAE